MDFNNSQIGSAERLIRSSFEMTCWVSTFFYGDNLLTEKVTNHQQGIGRQRLMNKRRERRMLAK